MSNEGEFVIVLAGMVSLKLVGKEIQQRTRVNAPPGAMERVVDPLFDVLTWAVTAKGTCDFYILGQDGQWWPITPNDLACAQVLYNAPQNYNMYIGPLISVG